MPDTKLYAGDTVTRPATVLQEMTVFIQVTLKKKCDLKKKFILSLFFFYYSPLDSFLVIYFTHGIKYLDENILSSPIASDQEPIKENGNLVFVPEP